MALEPVADELDIPPVRGIDRKCPRCEYPLKGVTAKGTPFNRVLAVEVDGRIKGWECPKCGHYSGRNLRPGPKATEAEKLLGAALGDKA